ncbi:MAG TPA: GNAT family N-acetyltransferase [Bosea sp. (in: a-proteobacteria)]|jgi:GNAT superfamily N-acetyltransferase|uniref:GNAT family N-acetyltransferase n=1 Tax=Bosea sp. (in: a-proteobacteria) TaxID=1871050 RepID=UPI002E0FEBED|nr:GNAT family N-acetyltransferase [Bosea sp. (in: a-proteobacteria)]
MPETFSISLNGVTDLPPGKVAAIVTSLEMTAAPPVRQDPPGTEGLTLEPIGAPDTARYLAMYRVLGERWMWFSRLVKPAAYSEAILGDAAVLCFVVRLEGRDVGLLELDFREAGEGELAFFGLEESVLGKGAGRWLMNRALELAWARPISRFWVHTCTLDHQGAPEFYQRSGFRAFKRSVEVVDDPRLAGHMPRASVPHHPVIE